LFFLQFIESEANILRWKFWISQTLQVSPPQTLISFF